MKENKELKNLLTSIKYIWYFDVSDDYTSTLWSRFRIEDNEKIEKKYNDLCLSKGSNLYEGEHFIFDFSLQTMKSKKDSKIQKITRKNDQNKTTVNDLNNDYNDIKTKKSNIATIISE